VVGTLDPALPAFLAKLTASGRTEPGIISFSCSALTATAADCGSAYERKPHMRLGSLESFFKNISVTWPYFSNSKRRAAQWSQ